ncbi:EF-P beta-lysylation protein EpmB [Pokkaliibacter sp. CJK22405]
MAAIIRDPATLLEQLELPQNLLPEAESAHALFPLRVPRPYLRRIRKGNLNDPLLKHVLPLGAEHAQVPGFSTDPLAEQQHNPRPGVIHKYHGRVLMIANGSCAINCRYCFRRHFPYEDNRLGKAQWQQSLEYIRQDSSITEVILSGGDPLTMTDERLAWLLEELAAIPHLRRLRIHSRLPLVIPSRVNERLIRNLEDFPRPVTLVNHINHAQEIDDEVVGAMKKLRQAGVHLLNQAVLLRGINDRLETQEHLWERVFEAGILPYYLFTLDAVQGAAHFDVPDTEAVALFTALQARLPGYLVPRLAREIPERANKTLLFAT